MESLPVYITVVFLLTVLLTACIFYQAANRSKIVLTIIGIWLLVQGIVASTGFYTVTDTVPPRFLLLVGPPMLLIVALFALPRGRKFLDSLDNRWLTWLHVVRIPVEVVLFWLFVHGLVPKNMTFEGSNFDILSGITAPLVVYLGYHKNKIGKWGLIGWNLVCLALLINIVSTAALSAPSPFQSRAFDQPNVGVLYFPFVWLPGCIVPLVLVSHLTVLRNLLLSKHKVLKQQVSFS